MGVPPRNAAFAGLNWRWFESGEGPDALVLLPGAVGGADIFFIVFRRFAASGRVLAVDVPYAADATRVLAGLDALLESRGVRRAILLGASFSGLLVQVYARRFPERTRALILSHTAALDLSRARRERRSAAIAARLPLPFTRGLLKIVVRLLLRKSPQASLFREMYFEALDGLSREDFVSRYLLAASLEEQQGTAWHGPVLIVHSNDDVVARPSEQARLRAVYPDADWHEFPGAGHSAYSLDPQRYADVLFEWTAQAAFPGEHSQEARRTGD
jgi:pimeloyl-ACP methyl ester carboxylesterase